MKKVLEIIAIILIGIVVVPLDIARKIEIKFWDIIWGK